LAAQLYSEFKQFFPNNAVEYFVSITITINPKPLCLLRELLRRTLSINEELENANVDNPSLLSGRRDILVVASVSCLYWKSCRISNLIPIERTNNFELNYCINSCKVYIQEQNDFNPGNFRIKGDSRYLSQLCR
jgi:excinuclease UvrABC helicase subunit UvrB